MFKTSFHYTTQIFWVWNSIINLQCPKSKAKLKYGKQGFVILHCKHYDIKDLNKFRSCDQNSGFFFRIELNLWFYVVNIIICILKKLINSIWCDQNSISLGLSQTYAVTILLVYIWFYDSTLSTLRYLRYW